MSTLIDLDELLETMPPHRAGRRRLFRIRVKAFSASSFSLELKRVQDRRVEQSLARDGAGDRVAAKPASQRQSGKVPMMPAARVPWEMHETLMTCSDKATMS